MRSKKILQRALLLPLAVILCLLSTALIAQVFAKYFVKDELSDSATTAHFDIRENLKNQTLDLSFMPGDTITVTISNHSEVDVKCILALTNKTGNLPVKSQEQTLTIEAGNTTNHTLSIEWDTTQNGAEHAGKVDLITLTLTCEQID